MGSFKISDIKHGIGYFNPNDIDKLLSLIRYYGGKYFQTPKYIPYIKKLAIENQCHTYVEATAGGARTLINLPSNLFKQKIYNEFDLGLCRLFQCVQDKEKVEKLISVLKKLPCNKEYFEWAKKNRSNPDNDIVTSGALAYICAMQSMNANMKSFKIVEEYYNAIDKIRLITPVLKNTIIMSADFRDVLERLWDKHILKFIDPPYHPKTRNQGALDIYPCELTEADHREMVQLLIKSNSWILCGYDPAAYGCDDYKPLEEAGAKKISMGLFNLGSAGKDGYSSEKEEFIWIKK